MTKYKPPMIIKIISLILMAFPLLIAYRRYKKELAELEKEEVKWGIIGRSLYRQHIYVTVKDICKRNPATSHYWLRDSYREIMSSLKSKQGEA